MGRPAYGLDEYLEWQERLNSHQDSGLSIDVFCLQEDISRSTFHRWARALKDGIPESMIEEQADREQAESGGSHFLPITIKAAPVEVELPNGAKLKLPLGVGQVVLIEVIRAVGTLRPWKAVS